MNVSSHVQASGSSGAWEWPKSGMRFRSMEETLRCPVCTRFLKVPVTLPCGHVFCSVCVRMALQAQSQCPHCRTACGVRDLRPCPVVATMVEHFKAVREPLLSMFPDSEAGGSVVPLAAFSTGAGSIQKEDGKHIEKREPIALPVFRLLKDKRLRELLRKAQLPDAGNRETIEWRYRTYLNLYNAECDSEAPRPVASIIKEVLQSEKEHQLAKKESKKTRSKDLRSPIPRSEAPQGAGPDPRPAIPVTRKMKENFRRLTQQIRERQAASKAKAAAAAAAPTPEKSRPLPSSYAATPPATPSEAQMPMTTPLSASSSWRTPAAATPLSASAVSQASPSPEPSSHWRVLYSHKLNQHFFFQPSTGIGQFQPPGSMVRINLALQELLESHSHAPPLPQPSRPMPYVLCVPEELAPQLPASDVSSPAPQVAAAAAAAPPPHSATTSTTSATPPSSGSMFSHGRSNVKPKAKAAERPGSLSKLMAAGSGQATLHSLAKPSVADTEWSCPMCTFLNKPTSAVCDMCGTQRPEKPPQEEAAEGSPAAASDSPGGQEIDLTQDVGGEEEETSSQPRKSGSKSPAQMVTRRMSKRLRVD